MSNETSTCFNETIPQYLDIGKQLTTLKGKIPTRKEWVQDKLSEAELYDHVYNGGNIGWVLGESDLVVDIDPRNGGLDSWGMLCADLDLLSMVSEATVKTPSGGVHIYMSKPPEMKTRKTLKDYPGIDFLSYGAQCVIPCSVFKGNAYLWADELIGEFTQQSAPTPLLDLIKRVDPNKVSLEEQGKLFGILSPDQLEEELASIPVAYYDDNESWFGVLSAAHHATGGNEDALMVFTDWSTADERYEDDTETIRTRWASLSGAKESAFTIKTLRFLVAKHGGNTDVIDKLVHKTLILDAFEEVDEPGGGEATAPLPNVNTNKEINSYLLELAKQDVKGLELDAELRKLKERTGRSLAVLEKTYIAATHKVAQMVAGTYPDVRIKNKTPVPLATYENFKVLVARNSIKLRYNVINKEPAVWWPGLEMSTDNNDSGAAVTSHVQSCMVKDHISTAGMQDHIARYMLEPFSQYNPVKDWIESAKWDGVDRIKQLSEYVKLVYAEQHEVLIPYLTHWLSGAVRAVTSPEGVSNALCLVLQGKQGVGKTQFGLSIIPKEFRYDWVKTGVMLNPKEKDSVILSTSQWLTELGELEVTFRRADVEALKAFLTESKDKYRKPYGRGQINAPRRTVFWASANGTEFLVDRTGSRRFLVISVREVMWREIQAMNLQQLWAQVHHMNEKEGLLHTLSPELQAKQEALNSGMYLGGTEEGDWVEQAFKWDTLPTTWRDAHTIRDLMQMGNFSGKLARNVLIDVMTEKAGTPSGKTKAVTCRKTGRRKLNAWLLPPTNDVLDDFDDEEIEDLLN